VEEHLRIGRRRGVNARLKVPCLVAGMIGGADSIGDVGLLRQGGDACAVWRGAAAVHAWFVPALVHLGERVAG
jgi:hypothetical protein